MPCAADMMWNPSIEYESWYPPHVEREKTRNGESEMMGTNVKASEEDVSVGTKGVHEYANQLPAPDVYLCLDVEATCDGTVQGGQRRFLQNFENEIIELPVDVICGKTGKNLSDLYQGWRFHTYVSPETGPSEFCTSLTGIDEETLSGAPGLQEALRRFESWLHRRNMVPWPYANPSLGELNCIWITDGNWDFGKFLWNDTQRKGVPFPVACTSWCDIREAFSATWPQTILKAPILQNMVKGVGLTWTGKPHRGHVDTKNLAALVSVVLKCNPTSLLPSRCIPYSLIQGQFDSYYHSRMRHEYPPTQFIPSYHHHHPVPNHSVSMVSAPYDYYTHKSYLCVGDYIPQRHSGGHSHRRSRVPTASAHATPATAVAVTNKKRR